MSIPSIKSITSINVYPVYKCLSESIPSKKPPIPLIYVNYP